MPRPEDRNIHSRKFFGARSLLSLVYCGLSEAASGAACNVAKQTTIAVTIDATLFIVVPQKMRLKNTQADGRAFRKSLDQCLEKRKAKGLLQDAEKIRIETIRGPQGLKPSRMGHLRGAKAPLFHNATEFVSLSRPLGCSQQCLRN